MISLARSDLGFGRFEQKLVVDLHDHFGLELFFFERLGHADHRDLDDVAGRALDRHIDRLAFGPRANGVVAVVDRREIAPAAEQRRDIAFLAGFSGNSVHVFADAFVGVEVIVDHLAGLGRDDADARATGRTPRPRRRCRN